MNLPISSYNMLENNPYMLKAYERICEHPVSINSSSLKPNKWKELQRNKHQNKFKNMSTLTTDVIPRVRTLGP